VSRTARVLRSSSPGAEPPLELAEVATDGSLVQSESVGRSGEPARFDHTHQHPHLIDVHV